MKVIDECGRESMIYRSFPFGGIAGFAVHAFVKGGFLKVSDIMAQPSQFLVQLSRTYFVAERKVWIDSEGVCCGRFWLFHW